jgi:hypothetical protein
MSEIPATGAAVRVRHEVSKQRHQDPAHKYVVLVPLDLPQWIVDWAQVIGAALGLVAIVVAMFALWLQRRDSMIERKALYELDVLRDLVGLVADPQGYKDADVLVALFPPDLPNLRPVREALEGIRRLPSDPVKGPRQDDDGPSRIWLERRKDMLTGLQYAIHWRHSMVGRGGRT